MAEDSIGGGELQSLQRAVHQGWEDLPWDLEGRGEK